jgi:hypothetical protein
MNNNYISIAEVKNTWSSASIFTIRTYKISLGSRENYSLASLNYVNS